MYQQDIDNKNAALKTIYGIDRDKGVNTSNTQGNNTGVYTGGTVG